MRPAWCLLAIARADVPSRLQFTTADDVIELKGRVACEVSTGDELLLTELIFNGVFNDLTRTLGLATGPLISTPHLYRCSIPKRCASELLCG